MNNWKIGLEARFGQWGLLVCRHPKKVVLAVVAFMALLATAIPNLRIDTSIESFFKPSDPQMVTYRQFQRDYGRDEFIIITVESEKIFSLAFLRKLQSYHHRLEQEVPFVYSVDSLVNVRSIYGADDDLVIEDLLETFPEDEAALAQIEARVADNPVYVNSVISESGQMTTLMVKLQALYTDKASGEKHTLGDEQLTMALRAIEAISEKEAWPEGSVQISGSPAVSVEMAEAIMSDMARFMMATFVIIGAVLYVLFRRLVAVALPLLTVFASMFSTVAFMALLDQPWQMPTAILPSFLLSVGVGNSIHFLGIFFQKYSQGKTRSESVSYALSHSGLAMFLTSMTTAAGLLSFTAGDMVPVSNLGLFSAIGIIQAFLYTVILLPALMMLVPMKEHTEEQKDSRVALAIDRIIHAAVMMSTEHPKTVVSAGLIIGVVAIGIAGQLKFQHNPMDWLPDDSKIKVATNAIDEGIGGTIAIELVIDSGEDRGVIDPEFLKRLNQFAATIDNYSDEHFSVGNVAAVSDIVKETHKALFENKAENYIIPADKELIAQELFLVETGGADDLFRLVDSNYRQVRMTVVLPWIETMHYATFLDYLEDEFDSQFRGTADLTVTGLVALLMKTFSLLIIQMGVSYMIAAGVIMLMMMALLGSVRYGFISMLPNFIPIAMALAIMKLANDPLDMYSMLIGSIAIGLAVDDTIHFMHNFQRYFHLTGNIKQAIEETLHTAGRAMLVTTIVLCCGFFNYMFSEMNNLFNFGLYTGLSIIFALLADFLFAPALMVLMHRKTEARLKIEAGARPAKSAEDDVSDLALN